MTRFDPAAFEEPRLGHAGRTFGVAEQFVRDGAVGAASGAALPMVALAQTKTTRIVISFPPGGPVDFVARSLAEQLGKELGQTVIVDNKAGANGAIGAGEVIRSAPDGSTLWFTSVGAAAINPSLYDKLAYDTQALSEAVRHALNNPTLEARLLDSGAEPAPSTPAELAALLKHDTDKWAKLIRDKKIRPE